MKGIAGKLSTKQLGHLCGFTATLLYAVNIPITKHLLDGHISSIGITSLRLVFGAVSFWIISLFVKKEKVSRKDHLIFLIGGVVGLIFRQLSFAVGIHITSTIDASIILTTAPFFALMISAIFLGEVVKIKKVAGIIIGGLGVFILVYFQTNVGEQNATVLGNLIILSNALSYASYLVLTKSLANKYSPITLMKWMYLYAAILFTPFTYNEILVAPMFVHFDLYSVILVLYPLIFCSVIAFILMVMAQKRISATVVAMYNNLQPFLVAILTLILGEGMMNGFQFFAALLVICGVYFVSSK